jgi:ribonuclease Z
VRLVNGSTGDPVLFIDYPGRNNALVFDAGENYTLDAKRLGDLEAVFLSHHHVDHFIGFDRIVRANLDQDKTLHVFGPIGTIDKVYDRIKSYEYQYFPFQKIRIRVTEILVDALKTGLLECTAKFPKPTIETTPWKGPTVYENAELRSPTGFTFGPNKSPGD